MALSVGPEGRRALATPLVKIGRTAKKIATGNWKTGDLGYVLANQLKTLSPVLS